MRNDRDETNDDDDGSAGVMIWHRVPRECIALDPAKKRESAVTSVDAFDRSCTSLLIVFFGAASVIASHYTLLRITALRRITRIRGIVRIVVIGQDGVAGHGLRNIEGTTFSSRKRIPRTAPISHRMKKGSPFVFFFLFFLPRLFRSLEAPPHMRVVVTCLSTRKILSPRYPAVRLQFSKAFRFVARILGSARIQSSLVLHCKKSM